MVNPLPWFLLFIGGSQFLEPDRTLARRASVSIQEPIVDGLPSVPVHGISLKGRTKVATALSKGGDLDVIVLRLLSLACVYGPNWKTKLSESSLPPMVYFVGNEVPRLDLTALLGAAHVLLVILPEKQ